MLGRYLYSSSHRWDPLIGEPRMWKSHVYGALPLIKFHANLLRGGLGEAFCLRVFEHSLSLVLTNYPFSSSWDTWTL